MSQGRIFTAADISADVDRSCDVCVIGSGAGGAAVAEALCAQGKDVVLLEEGSHHTRRDFNLDEARAYQQLYQDFANRATTDQAITILQGRSVGGGTTVNWSSCFRTPERILRHWQQVHGIEGLTEDALIPHWEFIERRLHVHPWPEDRINRNNGVLWEALGKLGYQRGLISRNVNNCANLGYCGVGCPVDAKQSALITLIPDAVEHGLSLYSDTVVRRLEWTGRKVSRVFAQVLDPSTRRPNGRTVTVRPRVVAVACGALNSPALLLRSGLTANGRVGKRTFLHPVIVSSARFPDRVEGFYGAPQSVYSKQFVDRGPDKMGVFIEVPPIHPMLASTLGGFGHALGDLLTQLPYVQAMIGITVDGLMPTDEGGTVGLRDGGTRLDIQYPFHNHHWEVFKFAMKEMARLQLAAGATVVFTPHTDPWPIRSEKELESLDHAPWERLKTRVVTAHQMGGCAMGKDAGSSVVDNRFRYWDLDNLYVTDGSVFPTSLGVNPQITIYGMARLASQGLAEAV